MTSEVAVDGAQGGAVFHRHGGEVGVGGGVAGRSRRLEELAQHPGMTLGGAHDGHGRLVEAPVDHIEQRRAGWWAAVPAPPGSAPP